MSSSDKVGPSGLTEAESEEIHRNLIQGTQIFGMIAAFAHLLAYIYSPWLLGTNKHLSQKPGLVRRCIALSKV
jgi:light-harvesting protein B-800-850 beta chain